ncbi:5'-3' exonuclease H3TH domain-containing protein [Mycoplasmopsis hyopharyngis]|uniref:5'-3' exonuclease n=1 Tax=Mycoplasmopsis hyopharyngis TaxID=29558 RepID=UPI003873701E
MKKDNFLLVDGNLLMFQSFYASYNPYFQVLQNANGVTTNGIHVFFMTLFKLIKKVEPKYLFVAFDSPGDKTWRSQEFSEYKAGRQKAPEIIFEQFQWTKKILSSLAIPWIEKKGDEADDLIATLSTHNEGTNNIIYSKDKDLLQLVNSNTSILKYDSFNHEYIQINHENFFDIFELEPSQIPDFKGLSGDSSDNLKGVKGIGDKTAIKLLNKYHTLENIYDHIDELSASVKTKMLSEKPSAYMCKKLAILNHNVDIPKIASHYFLEIKKSAANDIFKELELNVLTEKLQEL